MNATNEKGADFHLNNLAMLTVNERQATLVFLENRINLLSDLTDSMKFTGNIFLTRGAS